MNLKFDPNAVRIGIVTSLIGSVIFLYMLDPIIIWFYRMISSLGIEYVVNFVDSIYKYVAVGAPDHAQKAVLFGQVMIMAIVVLLNLTLVSLIYVESKINNDPEVVRQRAEKFKAISTRKSFCAIGVFSLLILLFVMKNVTADVIGASIIREFEHRIAIVAPYTTEKEIKSIRSQFALIKGRDDYKIMMKRVEQIAMEHNLMLPSREVYIESLFR